MKKLKLFFACLLMTVLSIGQVWAADYQLINSVDDLEANANYVIGSAASSSAKFMATTQNSDNRKSTDVISIVSGKITATDAVLVLKLEGSTGKWKFKTTNYAGTDGYLSNANSGTGNKCYVGTTEREFTISFSSDAAVITATGGNERKILRYNNGIFACYGSGQSPVYLFKEVASTAELVSITVTGDLEKKSYEAGDALDFSGLTATGNYDDDSHADLTSSVVWSATPALTAGVTSVTVTGTLNEISGNKVINGLTVAEHVVTPGTYDIPMTNALWGTSYDGSASSETQVSGKSHDVTVTLTKGGSTNMYINNTETRAYGSYSLVIGVPTGYVIKAMTFTKGSNWNCSTTTGTLTGQSWTGTANSVAFSFGGRTDFKAVSVTYELDVKYAINFSAPSNGTLVINDGVQNITSGATYHEGDELTVTATPNEGYKLDGIKVIETGSDPEKDVTSTVLSGTTLTVPAYAVTVSAEFSANEASFATLTLSEIGEETVYYDDDSKREGDIVSLPLTAASCSKVFVGWDPNVNCATAPTYAPGASYTLGASADNKLYAVYATPTVDTESEPELAQTHLYDTWTYSGPAADKDSYRLFGNGAYVESAEFDLSTLAKVIVYGGTYGGGTYNSFTIGDGTTIWKNGTVTGTNKAGVNTVTDADCTPLSGIGKLYVTSTCGNGDGGNSGNGIRISKVEIYTYGTTYGDYSTECTAKVEAPSFPVEQKEYTSATNISISAVTGATIHYTTDGSIPTTESATYSAPIELKERGEYTIKAIAVKNGFANSDVVTARYSINLPFANLAALVEDGLADGSEVIVSFADEVITYKGSKYISLTTKDANDNTIQIYHSSAAMPEAWVVGGKVSATAKRFTWTLFNENQWELVPVGEFAWATDLAYTAPKTVSSIEVTGEPTKKIYLLGETFDPAGLTVTVNYSDETSEDNPAVGVTFTTDPANGQMALEQTSIKVKATYNNVTSEEWFTVSGLTVNDLETKTIAEFIEAGGGRCYLIGTVSNITNTTYGNFDLTDASGSIYVYGCLDTEGASKNFASLGIEADDYIKVIAETYDLYGNPAKHEAIDVQFVEELEKPDVPVTSVSVANATVKVGKKVQLTATVLPAIASNKNVTWSVKEGSEAYAEVSATGVVTGKAEGNAVIVATSVADNTKFGECTVTVVGGINFAAGDFVLVEDANELTEGTYVIVAAAGTTYNVAMQYNDGESYNKDKAAVKDGKYLNYDADFGVYEIKNYIVNDEKVGISFYNEDAENYIALPSASNQLKVSAEQNANSSWTVAINEGIATITNKALTAREIRYNSGSPRFACYEGSQKDIALYKFKTPAAYRVYYNDNVAEEEIEVPAFHRVDSEGKVTITSEEPIRGGYTFDGWKDAEENVYEAGHEYTLAGDLTLYAQWNVAASHTLSYNANGGTLIAGKADIESAEVAENVLVTVAENVYEKEGSTFIGWKYEENVYAAGETFNMPAQNVELVAQWAAMEVKNVVILANYGDKWYALTNVATTNKQVDAMEVTYFAGKVMNLSAAEQAKITWVRTTIGDKVTFKNGDKYINGTTGTELYLKTDKFEWTLSDGNYLCKASDNKLKRTFIYNGDISAFKNYDKSNAGKDVYSAMPVVTEAQFANLTEVRAGLNAEHYYTICYPKQMDAIKGASLWEFATKDEAAHMAYIVEAQAPFAAGKPYLLYAEATTVEAVLSGDAVAKGGSNGALHGTLDDMDQVALNQAGSNIYLVINDELRRVDGRTGNSLPAQRAYVTLDDIESATGAPQPAPGRKVRGIPMQGQTATDIDNVQGDNVQCTKVLINGQLFILRGEKMYDVTGKLVK